MVGGELERGSKAQSVRESMLSTQRDGKKDSYIAQSEEIYRLAALY